MATEAEKQRDFAEMMPENGSASLVDKVAGILRWNDDASIKRMFSNEALEALRLAELFKDVEPQVHVLPLETMAGGRMPRWALPDQPMPSAVRMPR